MRSQRAGVGLGIALSWFCLSAPLLETTAFASPDADPPTVNITAPANGATVNGPVLVTANADDAVGVVGVQFRLNGANLGAEDTTAPYAAAWNTVAGGNGSQTLTARARDAVGHVTVSSPVTVTVLNTNTPDQIGQWAPLMTWPLVAVHGTLTPTGEVLMWNAWQAPAAAKLWNPNTQTFIQTFTDATLESGVFCAGHTLMSDGRVLVTGGHVGPHDDSAGAEEGIVDTNIFNATLKSWLRVADMNLARWYPTTVPLGDGRVVTLSGQIVPGQWADTPELYDPAANTWTLLSGVDTSDMQTGEYLRAHLLPNGTLYIINPDTGQCRFFNVATQSWTPTGASPAPLGSTVMYQPGKILTSGGGDRAQTNASQTEAAVIDLTQPSPAWRSIAPMSYPRYEHNLTLLADGRVLSVGGSTTLDQNATDGIFVTEQWDPQTELWRSMTPTSDPRMYHSVALLLPDGRLLAAGGGRVGGANDYATAELYSPPYLFKGPRPTITSAPSAADYGETMSIPTPDAAAIASVALIPLGSVTHTIDPNQRYIELSFTKGANALLVESPTNPNVAPPGHYMLFILNANGVPAIAPIIKFPKSGPAEAPLAETFQESGGQVVIEAEHYQAKIPRNGQDWVIERAISGFSKTGYLTSLPNSGTMYNTDYVTKSPEVVYNVNFTTTGTYYVWVRGSGASGNDDSLHAGVDGSGPASADRIGGFPSSWTWKRDTMDGVPATLVVTSPGLHTIHLWIREDGFRIDKLLLRTSSSSTAPSGKGPVESPRTLLVADTTAPAISAVNVSNIADTSATIAWLTDEPATSQVAYGTTTDYGQGNDADSAKVTSHSVPLTGLSPNTLYYYRVLSTDLAGHPAIPVEGTFTTLATSSPAFQESAGQVVIEAEHYDAKLARNGQDWTPVLSPSGYAGAGALQALPNSGVIKDTGYVGASPELIYNVNFTTTGTYYVWIRGSAASGTDDSLHAGLDGTGPASADRLSSFTSSGWVWKRDTMDAAPATLVIATPGSHTICLWMREDGLKVDRILLRTSSSATAPSGGGPAESPRTP